MFCPECGSLLKVKKGKSVCSCGYSTETTQVMTEKMATTPDVAVGSEIDPMANTQHVCKKCGFDRAVFNPPPAAIRDTWNNAEADRASYVCGKCGFREFID